MGNYATLRPRIKSTMTVVDSAPPVVVEISGGYIIVRSMIAVALVLLLVPVCGDADSGRPTLAGLGGVKVIVEVDSDLERALSPAAVRRDVEGLLRQRGITLLADAPWSQTPGRPVLKVEIDAEPGPEGSLAYSVTVELEQDVRLARDPSLLVSTATWAAPQRLGVIKRADAGPVREALRDLVEAFIKAYTEMNPKR